MSDTEILDSPTQPRQQRRALVIAHEPDGPARQIEARLIERGFAVDTHIVTHDYEQPNQATPWPSFDGYDIILPMGSVRSLGASCSPRHLAARSRLHR